MNSLISDLQPTPVRTRLGEVPPQMRERNFKDSVHQWITLSGKICKIIDTPQFQRLRHVKQLGTSYYVWPAASHNRFEHCLGVAHLAQMQIKFLQKQQPELDITDEDVECVTIAGLCHDLGHGPWSHVWDSLFIPKALPHKKWRHEDASEMMFDDLIKEDHVMVSEREAIIIKALISGDSSRCEQVFISGMNVKSFLFEIVANKRNGLDVDKFDYIARDQYAIGQGENVSLGNLHKRIYNHKTAKAIEYMIIDALLSAEPHMKIAEHIDDPKKFVFLTDDIKTRIEMTTEPELAEARALFRRINIRDLYKCVDYKIFPWKLKDICRQHITAEAIVEAAKKAPFATCDPQEIDGSDPEQVDAQDVGPADPQTVEALDPKHVIIDMAEMHYGMKEKNPLNYVQFYSKYNSLSRPANAGDISNIMPASFGEILLRVYTRDARFHGIIQMGFHRVLADLESSSKELDEEQQDTEELDALDLDVLTADTTPAPATPREFTRTLSRVLQRQTEFPHYGAEKTAEHKAG
ncbi:hypothetical protein EW026_g597 [Hermanssonia centrifuga]|uniref:HD/PDEase domain-containing protein n=1 Tax=Hermanssonia centrifuga TaxID=98765 RepID=A0A4S4KTZ7_9APHY|nr:hypothetical protein EW026_g597 [Hermanssonia centrifuga]